MNAPARKIRPDPNTGGQAIQNLIASLGEDPFAWIEDLRDAGKRKAQAEAVAYRLEKERKALIARLACEFQSLAEGKMSEAKAERLARADKRYQQHIEGTAAAIEERELAKSEYWSLSARLDWLRASIAHENALSKIEGSHTP